MKCFVQKEAGCLREVRTFVIACDSETCPRSQRTVLLRQSIIDDEIWQAIQPYGPFFLLQLLVFPERICADQVVCVCVCVCVYMPMPVCHWLCPEALHEQLSIIQYVMRREYGTPTFHYSICQVTWIWNTNFTLFNMSGDVNMEHQLYIIQYVRRREYGTPTLLF